MRSDKYGPVEKAGNMVITLEELKQSMPVPREINRPKPLWEIIGEIYAVLDENDILYSQEAVYVHKASTYTAAGKAGEGNPGPDPDDPASFRLWTFDNVFTSIVISDDLNEMEGAIQIAYNRYGMQVSFGLTYESRSKFAHLGEEDAIMSTYACGDIKVLPYFVMVHKVRHWFPFNNKHVIDQLERSKTLMNKSLDDEVIFRFIERFYRYSTKYSDCLDDNTLILPETFDHFMQQLRYDAETQFSGKKNVSAWDLFTLGNAILKPDNGIPLTAIIPLGFMWGGYTFSRLI